MQPVVRCDRWKKHGHIKRHALYQLRKIRCLTNRYAQKWKAFNKYLYLSHWENTLVLQRCLQIVKLCWYFTPDLH